MASLLCITGSWNSQLLCRRKSIETATHKHSRVMISSSPACHRSFDHDKHSKLESSSPRLENGDHVNGKRKRFVKGRSEAREQRRLRLWYLTSCSFSHILRKARAFYNEFCCDAVSDDGDDAVRRQGYNSKVMSVDPYFSIPVTPHA